jgi:acylphosphatase
MADWKPAPFKKMVFENRHERRLNTRRESMSAFQVLYEGRVQGVGFRYSVRQIAKGFNVTGWVRNLADGRVELQIAGEDDELRAFLDAIRESELRGLIKHESQNPLAAPLSARGFEIRL